MAEKYTKWVAAWGNATSIINQKPCTYSKDLTLRYPVRMCFSGDALRFRFSNLTGREPVTVTEAFVARTEKNENNVPGTTAQILFDGKPGVTILPGEEVNSDEVLYDVTAGETVSVSFYLEDFTDMNSGVHIDGPLSKGYYAYGRFANAAELPPELSRDTQWFWFLNTVDVRTEARNHALICYGDSITAQSWPDYLTLRLAREGITNVSVIRRAVSGTRILREYDCITYASYGLKGANRFEREIDVAGADAVLIQHGINDIIHPVGTEVNRFRPWSDLPTAEEMIRGVEEIYIGPARKKGLKVWSGTLLPIFGWRTYAPFREELKNTYNEWLRTSAEFDGCVDFDLAVRDPEKPEAFRAGFDSGDHLHPSEAAYKAMAEAVPEALLR